MSKMFYHVMQDNVGNLLFDVSGTMRLAGSGTLATIYGDEALTVILPNPMTNHASFGSFKCFLGAGDYDFYMAKAGYTFETLTGVQGAGSLADQDASNVNITGGSAAFTGIVSTPQRFEVSDSAGTNVTAFVGAKTVGATRWNLYMSGTALNYLEGSLSMGIATPLDLNNKLFIYWQRGTRSGIMLRPQDSDTVGSFAPIVFTNQGGSVIGSISTNASATAYNTSSDRRLKDCITPLEGALDVVRRLNPVSFLWKSDGTPGRGFVADEAQAIVPEAVSGDVDAVDEAGQIAPQQMDLSKLVVYLVGACQALAAQVEALTARLEAAGG